MRIAPSIQNLIYSREWQSKETFEQILGIYEFVRDEILFGYNHSDNLPASKVLQDGYGQCNTKGTLFMAPQNVVHSWVEIYFEDKWLNLEGIILDVAYLKQLQDKFQNCSGSFCGYGVATLDFKNPPIYWNNNDTYIQKEGINQDFCVSDSPDAFFASHPQKLSAFKKFAYENFGRHLMNLNVKRIRGNREVIL